MMFDHRYGLQTAFSEIERLSHEVTSSGNPIEMDLKTRYVVKGVNKEQTVASKVHIHTEGDKITRVEDRWDGELNDGPMKNVSLFPPEGRAYEKIELLLIDLI